MLTSHISSFLLYYRPQTKYAEVMFLQVSVYPPGGGGVHGRGACLGACMAGGHAWWGYVHGGGCVWRGGGHMAGGCA